MQIREVYSKLWYNRKKNSKIFSKITSSKLSLLQISVIYNNVIVITSYFLKR